MSKKWCSLGELESMTRTRVMDANDMLDAFEEAEDVANAKAEKESKRDA